MNILIVFAIFFVALDVYVFAMDTYKCKDYCALVFPFDAAGIIFLLCPMSGVSVNTVSCTATFIAGHIFAVALTALRRRGKTSLHREMREKLLPLAEEDCLIWLPDLEIRDVYVLADDGPTIKITMGKAVKCYFPEAVLKNKEEIIFPSCMLVLFC